MSLKKRVSRIGGLTSDIIKSAESASNERGPTLTTTPDEITRLWNHEYGKALRACLSRAEVREIVSVGRRKAWPQLNDGAARIGSMREFESGRPISARNFESPRWRGHPASRSWASISAAILVWMAVR